MKERALRQSGSRGPFTASLLAAALVVLAAPAARANCNLIPTAPDEFRSSAGTVSNTVAAPGNPVRVRVDFACSPGAPGFSPVAADNQVTLRFVPPGSGANPALVTEVPVPAGSVSVSNCGLGGGRCDTLRLVVPAAADLDAALAPDGDGLGPAGPAEIVVRAPDTTELARIGPLYEQTLACADQQPEPVFGHFTVLPEENDFQLLSEGGATSVRATLDGNGNLLIPFDYTGVLPGAAGAAIFRILEGAADVDAFTASPGLPVRVPAAPWVRSFSFTGRPIPPVLEVDSGGAMILGSVDATLSLLRLSRVDPFTGAGPALYDFSDRLSAGGRGPIVIAGVAASARESAPLGTLVSDAEGISFARSESADGDLNADLDEFDQVPQVVDVASGAGFSTQQAVTQVTMPGYAKPALATGSGLVAMATSEARQGHTFLNGDGDAFDSILRVFRTSGVEATLALPVQAVDPLPEVAGRTLAVSGPYVFFRTRESDAAPRATENATPVLANQMQRADSQAPALSHDGRYVAFDSFGGATFVPGLNTTESAIWVLDRQTGLYERITRDALGDPLPGNHLEAGISADGRYVSYLSDTEAIAGAADGGLPDVFLFDRQTGTTQCASCAAFLTAAASDPDLAAGGRYLVFHSNGLVRWDRVTDTVSFVLQGIDTGCGPNACSLTPLGRPTISGDGQHVAVRAVLTFLPSTVLTDQIMLFSTGQNFITFIAPGFEPEMSADGRVIALQTDTALVTDDNNLAFDAYVVGRDPYTVEWISLPTEEIGTNGGLSARKSAVSADGRFVSFVFDSVSLAPGDPSGRSTYRYDRATNVIEGISVDSGGTNWANGFSNAVAISGDGRVTAFSAFANDIAPDSFDDVQTVFVRAEGPTASLNAADADAADTVLQVLDTSVVPGTLRAAARVPAEAIAVDGARAAFLTAEADDGGVSRNADADATDRVARAYDAAADQLSELGVAATAIDVAGDTVCLLVPEGEEPNPAYSNGDGDVLDEIVAVWSFGAGGLPTSLGVSATEVQAVPGGCVFTTSEQDEQADLNGDGDDGDPVLRHWNGVELLETGLAAFDFLARGDLVAFRVCEFDQGFEPLNGDGDDFECVMHVLRRSTNEVKSTGRAAHRCEIPGCDPFFEPFRVGERTVSFLTDEPAQSGFGGGGVPGFGCAPTGTPGGCDLNGDADGDDELISVFNVESEKTQVITLAQDGQAPLPQPAPPFPTEQSGKTVLQVVVPETTAGTDVNGDGQITDAPVLILIGDTDNDGTLDTDATGARDTCVETANSAQVDADRDQLGDGACDPAPTPALPGDVPCDVDLDGVIDAADVSLVFGDRGMAARASDPRDPDQDGVVSVLDVSACSRSCTYTDCAAAPPAGGSCGLLGAEGLPLLGLALWWRRRARKANGKEAS